MLLSALLFVTALPVGAQFSTNQPADRVIGAADFATPGSASDDGFGMNTPNGIAIDPSTQKLFVSSTGQNRVLRYANSTALANGAAAEAVFGQDDLTATAPGTAANRLTTPYGIHVDSQGRLWIADMENDRVLMFEDAATRASGANADLVLGQTNFTNSGSAFRHRPWTTRVRLCRCERQPLGRGVHQQSRHEICLRVNACQRCLGLDRGGTGGFCHQRRCRR